MPVFPWSLQKRKEKWRFAAAVYMVVLLAGSLRPVTDMGRGISPVKEILHNLLHVPAYSLLAFLWVGLLLREAQIPRRYVFALAFCVSVSYGAIIELLQSFSPGRTPSFSDVLLNSLGAALALVFLKLRARVQ